MRHRSPLLSATSLLHRVLPAALACLGSIWPCATLLRSQEPATAVDAKVQLDERLLEAMEWRLVGPFRGGRCAAVCGVRGEPDTFWFGATGGGVYRTEDAGRSWRNVSDGFFGGSIGAVEVAPSDHNVVYVGGGEVTVRGNVSHGDGIWKSTDRGKTWTHVGLSASRHVPRIRVHPQNPDLVYAAVLGDLYKSSAERGIYRSKDGGKSWARIHYVNDDVGAVDLCLDPTNPRRMFASMWRVRRTPWELSSGGEGSSIWRSTDGGDTWSDLSGNSGMPKAPLGISGVAVCPTKPDRVYAIIEANEGGVFRSDDGGDSWRRVNEERSLRQRAWYYSRIYADPVDADTCYVVNVQFWKSKDGGKSFSTIRTPHSDNHDLWIDPDDPRRMVEGNDGGACVTVDGGNTWSTQDNQPTAQFYRVTTDNAHPYRILGGQQDNSTVRIASRGERGGIGERDWEPTAGGESAWIAVDPQDPDIVFGGSYGGFLTMVNHRTGERRNVNVWPRNPMGHGAKDLRYRFQWNFPIVFSPHEPHALYTSAQVLFRSTDRGQSWQAISPDLTRNEEATLAPSGGPITKDNTGVEYYATIFAFCESPRVKGLLWCGSDDGRLHVSKDDGNEWIDVTPKGLPEWMMINSIDAHPFVDGGLYVAGTRYKSGDFEPYLYVTLDYGTTWRRCDAG
ncbi:MAG: glycosyl hydrolase, partial [Planctomycetes bacterium]|nr:glycosyl hydrolase [Planctomycetota bacterium]